MFVISGDTGATGLTVAQSLINRGLPVRVIVNSEEKATSWQVRGIELVIAEINNTESMTASLKDACGAYFWLPPDLTDRFPVSFCRRRSDVIVNASLAANLKHCVILSPVGAQGGAKSRSVSTADYLKTQLINASIPLSVIYPGRILGKIQDLMSVIHYEEMSSGMTFPPELNMEIDPTRKIGLTIVDALVNPPKVSHRTIEIKWEEEHSAEEITDTLGTLISWIRVRKGITTQFSTLLICLPVLIWRDSMGV